MDFIIPKDKKEVHGKSNINSGLKPIVTDHIPIIRTHYLTNEHEELIKKCSKTIHDIINKYKKDGKRKTQMD